MLPALIDHQEAIQKKIIQYQKLLGTVVKTISVLKGVETMSDREYFEGFDERMYEEEARERWGGNKSFEESQRNWSSYSAAKKEEIKQLGGEITRKMAAEDPDVKADDPGVQQAVADYHQYINQFFYSCDPEHLRLLADMWVEDPRFAQNYERIREGGAEFVRNAVHIYCDRQKQKGA